MKSAQHQINQSEVRRQILALRLGLSVYDVAC